MRVRQAHHVEQALNAAVLAVAAVQRVEHDVGLGFAERGDECGHVVRHVNLVDLEAALRKRGRGGAAGDKDAITARIRAIRAEREDSQPTQARTGGSTFANPPGGKAWQLIDAAGCRGQAVGGAQVSPKHTNFLINIGTATATELEALGEEVRAKVKAKSGVDLHWEIRRIGLPLGDPKALVKPS